MSGKKAGTRFTILLRENDTRHLQAADILNSQGFHGKAQYIVNAILHYADHDAMQAAPRTVSLDERSIDAIVSRLLGGLEIDSASRPAPIAEDQQENILLSSDEINFDDALEAIGGEGFSAITDALEMFRSK